MTQNDEDLLKKLATKPRREKRVRGGVKKMPPQGPPDEKLKNQAFVGGGVFFGRKEQKKLFFSTFVANQSFFSSHTVEEEFPGLRDDDAHRRKSL